MPTTIIGSLEVDRSSNIDMPLTSICFKKRAVWLESGLSGERVFPEKADKIRVYLDGLTLPYPLWRAQQRESSAQKRRIVGNPLVLDSQADFDRYLTSVWFP